MDKTQEKIEALLMAWGGTDYVDPKIIEQLTNLIADEKRELIEEIEKMLNEELSTWGIDKKFLKLRWPTFIKSLTTNPQLKEEE